ncbi:MAG TPA: biotin transporter BioY [Candidatus Nanopelagicaceae bacterium]|nr:biotin transporter BioY [Candidatus Nanopelagicaceae bacterium]
MATIAPLRAVFVPRTSALTNTSLLIGGTVFMSLMAQIAISVPGSPVPITGQTLGVLLIGSAYGASLGLATMVIYLALGVMGAPILAQGAHGFARLSGPTGGYLVGMLFASLAVGALANRRWDVSLKTSFSQMLLGEILVFVPGLVWLKVYTGQGWGWTLAAGLSPFVVGEIIKIGIAGTALPSVWALVRRVRS